MSEEVKEVVEEVKEVVEEVKKETKLNVWQKLSKVQVELKAPKNQYNSFGKYKYRSCEDICEGLKPLLDKYGFAVIFDDTSKVEGDRHYIVSTAIFIDSETGNTVKARGQAKEDESKKGMDGAQLTGSTTSYARKYALNALFLIDDTKDSDATNDHGKATTEAPNKVTNQHLNKLFGLAIRKGVDQSTVRKQVSKAFNKTAEEMTLTEYERVVAGYEKMKEKE